MGLQTKGASMARHPVNAPVEDELLNELAASLLEEYAAEPRQPEDVDPYQLSNLDPLHRNYQWWTDVLKAKVKAGEIVAVEVWDKKRKLTVYRRRAR